jgi:hypothetical protein
MVRWATQLFCDLPRIAISLTNNTKQADGVITQRSHKTYRTYPNNLKLSSPKRPYRFWDPPASYSMGTGILFRVKRPGHEVVHSPPLTNECSYTSAPLCAFMAWTGTSLPIPLSYVSCWQDVLV